MNRKVYACRSCRAQEDLPLTSRSPFGKGRIVIYIGLLKVVVVVVVVNVFVLYRNFWPMAFFPRLASSGLFRPSSPHTEKAVWLQCPPICELL